MLPLWQGTRNMSVFLCRACSYTTDEHWLCFRCGVVEPMETGYCKICFAEFKADEV